MALITYRPNFHLIIVWDKSLESRIAHLTTQYTFRYLQNSYALATGSVFFNDHLFDVKCAHCQASVIFFVLVWNFLFSLSKDTSVTIFLFWFRLDLHSDQTFVKPKKEI